MTINELKALTIYDKKFKKLKKELIKLIKSCGVYDLVELYESAIIIPLIRKHYVRSYDYVEGGDYFCIEMRKFEKEEEGKLLKEYLENE